MARPKKATVDYFPHVCNHGQTMFIVEQRYGNDGYAFWFKLLELLGTAEGHALDCRNEATWQFLQAKTRLNEQTCVEILDLLARLGAIDGELWAQRIVWSQNFVDGVADAYRNRRVETPARPSFYSQKPAPGVISTPDNPQSKLKESILKESKSERSADGAEDDYSASPSVPYQAIVHAYHLQCGGWPLVTLQTPARKQAMREWWAQIGDVGKFELAFKRAGESDFLSGRNGKWTSPKPCDFDWLLSKSNLATVMEGAYDNRRKDGGSRSAGVARAAAWLESIGAGEPK